ncbi:energy-coupling factor transporter transmembrane component T family protein [Occultella kanbiaonis]|uniref:energy-coupling factor transporter transmembrane component T family protein n=1 Tax=Occultella kanbiaonis TaxID=2675754 RepID=UPI0013D863F3|nr:energy-coupling factor transporter transmembrane component T [Occultella kanbiaonis]
MFLEYFPGMSFAHRADVRSKLLAFTVVIVATFLFTAPLPNAILAVGALALLFSLGVPPAKVGKLLLPLLPIVVLIVLFAAFSPPPGRADVSDVLLYAWPGGHLPLTVGGLLYGASLGLRIITMVCLTSALVLCTPIEHFTALMQTVRMPFPIVFIVMTALRFVPTMQHRSEQILDAQRARGAKIDGGGVVGTIRAYTTIMVPLFSTGIRMSEDLSAAMLSRGYGITKQPTRLLTLRMTWRDPVLIAVAVAALGLAVWLRAHGTWML